MRWADGELIRLPSVVQEEGHVVVTAWDRESARIEVQARRGVVRQRARIRMTILCSSPSRWGAARCSIPHCRACGRVVRAADQHVTLGAASASNFSVPPLIEVLETPRDSARACKSQSASLLKSPRDCRVPRWRSRRTRTARGRRRGRARGERLSGCAGDGSDGCRGLRRAQRTGAGIWEVVARGFTLGLPPAGFSARTCDRHRTYRG